MSIVNRGKELTALLQELDQQKSGPPLHLWDPPATGHSKITIRRDGTWWHDGGEIKKLALRQLFASILRKDDDVYYLVTPVEKQEVTVEDSPFLATELVQVPAQEGAQFPQLVFTTNLGDKLVLSEAHPFWFATADNGDEVPYILVREGLSARIPTTVYYQCVALLREVKKDDYTTEWWLVSGDYAVCVGAM